MVTLITIEYIERSICIIKVFINKNNCSFQVSFLHGEKVYCGKGWRIRKLILNIKLELNKIFFWRKGSVQFIDMALRGSSRFCNYF